MTDAERLERAIARWDTGGWTQYAESEPMAGTSQRGRVEHAVLQSEPTDGMKVCTRRTLCGGARGSVLSRATSRAFDESELRPYPACRICARLIKPFRGWQAANGIDTGYQMKGSNCAT